MNDSLFTPIPPLPPPRNIEAEQAVVGALLANNRRALDLCGNLQPSDFADDIHARIFDDVRQIILAGGAADPLSLKGHYERLGTLAAVGGQEYLVRLAMAFPSLNVIPAYAKVIRDSAVRRRQIEIGQGLIDAAHSPVAPAETAAEAAQELDRICAGTVETLRTLRDAVGVAAARAEATYRGEKGETCLTTGIRTMDALWGGLWPGQLYYLMARSRTGKTPAAMQIVRNVAADLLRENPDQPGHVHFFSMEMTADDLATINLASTTRWSADEVRAGQIGDTAAWMEFDCAREALATLPVVIDDEGNLTISALETRARAVRRSHRSRLIVVDFLELIGRDREHSRMSLNEWLPAVGYRLKRIAKAAGVPVLALRQVNKSRDSESGAPPTLADLPFDGGQAADGIFALHRPELTMGDSPPPALGKTMEKRAEQDAAWHRQRDAARGVAMFGSIKRRFGPANLWRDMIFDGPRMLLREKPSEAEIPDMWGDGT
jgi:replicative DNA helicase